MKVLIIINDPPYGTERSYNGLRLAGALARREDVEVRMFLFGDSVGCAVANQKVPSAVGHRRYAGKRRDHHRECRRNRF